MVNHCVVVGCTNCVRNKPGLRFYLFLSEGEPERRRWWTGAEACELVLGKACAPCDKHFVTGL